jgi:hypothetical protein
LANSAPIPLADLPTVVEAGAGLPTGGGGLAQVLAHLVGRQRRLVQALAGLTAGPVELVDLVLEVLDVLLGVRESALENGILGDQPDASGTHPPTPVTPSAD